jgi:hypothetical protein
MHAPAHLGDTAAATCHRCHKIVSGRYELRTVLLRRTRLRVPDVLVAVCPECDHTIAFARQSLAQLREAGAPK